MGSSVARYRMLNQTDPKDDGNVVSERVSGRGEGENDGDDHALQGRGGWTARLGWHWRGLLAREVWTRETYPGALAFNLLAFTLPALYGTLSKLWIANIDASLVVTTDVYTYIGVIIEVLNEGLPRAAWTVIGDRSNRTLTQRIGLTYTLIATQFLLGTLLTIVFVASAPRLAAAFVPAAVRATSLAYVRISSVQALSSALEVAVATATRALDHPDVPVLISGTKFLANILLDLLVISRFHVGSAAPTVTAQAWVRMACDVTAAGAGLLYFLHVAARAQRAEPVKAKPTLLAVATLLRPGVWTFCESAQRNAVYLWLVHNIISMGADYATAWGVFNTIRWGLVMVVVQALEATTLTFVGHSWGAWRRHVGIQELRPKATGQDFWAITHYALISCAIAVVVEVLLCIFLSFFGIRSYAWWLSQSDTVAAITQHMWKTIDWCYIFYALSTQAAAILLASVPRWYFLQALTSNLLWMLPWAVVVAVTRLDAANAWTYHGLIFGGALVFSCANVLGFVLVWAWMLRRGKVRLVPVGGGGIA